MEVVGLPGERACKAWVGETQMEEENENENERDGVGVAFEVVEMMIWWFGEAFFSSSSSSVCFVNSEFGDNNRKSETER